jgi:hypothetical protein
VEGPCYSDGSEANLDSPASGFWDSLHLFGEALAKELSQIQLPPESVVFQYIHDLLVCNNSLDINTCSYRHWLHADIKCPPLRPKFPYKKYYFGDRYEHLGHNI